jgi:ABC-type dipeptide/oligopeptide/nickel transport system ATPase component
MRGNKNFDDLPGSDITLNPVLTVGYQIMEPLKKHLGWVKKKLTKMQWSFLTGRYPQPETV